ncbi:MAG: hypothetical protein ACM335_03210 [Deltaproteobacteria bacterium]
MLTFDAVFNAWMILSAVLVFLKIKKLINWDWPIILAPAIVGIAVKGLLFS